MSDFIKLVHALEKIPQAIQESCEDGLKKAGVAVVKTAKGKLGEYQPSIGEYPAWVKLKPKSIRAKFLSKSKSFHINESNQVRINITNAGKKFLTKYGTNAKTFSAGKQFQASGTSDDSPLVDTGHLRAAITTDDSDVARGQIYIGVSGVPYAASHEFGDSSRNIPQRPYLRPSVVENKEEIEQQLKQSLADGIRKAGNV